MKNSIGKPSLFAFQDIITSVIGIFVFISILLILSISIEAIVDIVDSKSQETIANANIQADINKTQSQIQQLKKIIDTKKQEQEVNKIRELRLAALKKNSEQLQQDIEKMKELLKTKSDSKAIKEMLEMRKEYLKKDIIAEKAQNRKMEAEIGELENEIADIKAKIKKYKDAIIIHAGTGNAIGGKSPIYILCKANSFVYLATDEQLDFDTLKNRLKNIPKTNFYLQLFFTPSGVNRYFDLYSYCKMENITFGAIAILEEEKLVYEK